MVIIIIIIALAGVVFIHFYQPFGDVYTFIKDDSYFQQTDLYDGTFHGDLEINVMSGKESQFAGEQLIPQDTVPVKKLDEILPANEDQLKWIWFGHSSSMLQMQGMNILIDPVLSDYASPISLSTQAFKGTHIYDPKDFPDIDFLLISHDHWDHLDYPTVMALKDNIRNIICPLGTDAHFLRCCGLAASIVVIEVFGQGIRAVLIFVQVLDFGQPVAVDCLVVDKQAEWLFFVALVFHPVDTHVRYYVGQVALALYGVVVHCYEVGIVVIALSRHYFPVVETSREAFQVPLSDDCGLVTSLLKQFRHGLLRAVEYASSIVGKSVGMAVLAGNHAGAAGTAQRVGDEAVGKSHAITSNAVEVWGLDKMASIATHHLCRVVIGHDVNYVKRFGFLFGLLARCQAASQSTCAYHCE